MTEERIVAVGLLTQRDLDVLGSGFRRLFTVEEPACSAISSTNWTKLMLSLSEGASQSRLSSHQDNHRHPS